MMHHPSITATTMLQQRPTVRRRMPSGMMRQPQSARSRLRKSTGSVGELAKGDWDRVLDVNLRGPFLLAKAVFPYIRNMLRASQGTIVNVSSVAGKQGWANASVYCASKFGLTGFTQALAAEGKPHGIRACILYRGGMDTYWRAWSSTERQTQAREPRFSTRARPPADVAELIVWIATAPSALVLNEAIISPLEQEGWP